jgi:replicative DNA helicase
MDKRMSEMARSCIKTNWEVMDQLLDGGLSGGELSFVCGGPGTGKSWILTRMGVEAMKQGKNVCHFTLELNENYVGLRYDACFSGIEFKNIEVVKKKIEPIKGKLFIKYFPIKTVAAQNLKMHIERIQMITGNKIDYVVVDYADLLRPLNADKNSNSYTEAGNVYEELRTMAGELQCPVISASQANRGSAHADTVQGHDVADSYRKVMIGDFVFSLSRKPDDKMSDTARIHIIKNRFGPDGQTLMTHFNASNGDIRIYEENSPQGIELKRKMQDGEDNIKDKVRDHWNQIKKQNGEES